MRRILLGWVLATFGLGLLAAERATAAGPEAGQLPPPLTIAKWLQGPDQVPATWESLRGKAVVLEFWAPWCGPCVGAIPHLNDLALRLKGKPVVFLAVTDDKEDKVLKLLGKKPMDAWVGLDKEGATFKSFGVKGIPETILVYPSGKVAAVTNPYYVSKEALEEVLAGREPKLEKSAAAGWQFEAGREPGDTRPTPLFEVLIRPLVDDDEGGATSVGESTYLSHGVSIKYAIGAAYDIQETRIFTDLPIFEKRYTVVVRVPDGDGDLMKPLLRQALETSFGFTARRENREMACYVLTAPAGIGKLKVSDGLGCMMRSGKGRYIVQGQPLDVLGQGLESRAQRARHRRDGSEGQLRPGPELGRREARVGSSPP